MKISKALLVLSLLTALLALVQAGAGLFSVGGSGPFSFTVLRGETVQINGQGMYYYDTAFKAPILQGTDAVTLFLAIPLLLVALAWALRGSLRGRLFLAGVLAYLLYNAGSVALGAAYNSLFLVYVAYFSASLFAFIMALASIDRQVLARCVGPRFPHRGAAALMFFSGLGLAFAWLPDILGALSRGAAPAIASYTTEVTYVFDLGIIIPVAVLTGILLLRRRPWGYPLAVIMLVILGIVGVLVIVQTVAQSLAGISIPAGEFIGKVGSFVVLSLVADGLAVRSFGSIAEAPGLAESAARAG